MTKPLESLCQYVIMSKLLVENKDFAPIGTSPTLEKARKLIVKLRTEFPKQTFQLREYIERKEFGPVVE